MRILIILFSISSFSPAFSAPDSRCKAASSMRASTPLQSRAQLQARFLKSHNEVRNRYNLPNLVWNQKLADYAQQWAEQLKNKKCQMMHRPNNKYGENLAMNWTSKKLSKNQFDKSPEFAVLSWAKECKDYSTSSHKCQSGKVCGHFTQVAWKNSRSVGCGVVTCDGKENTFGQGRLELWVCNYDPPGNFLGQNPF